MYEHLEFRKCVPNTYKQASAAAYDEKASGTEYLRGQFTSIKTFADANNPFLLSLLEMAAATGI